MLRALRAYFNSGWAFLIPYLAAYLLYWWLKWPVNPEVSGQSSAVSAAGADSLGFGPWSSAFCLLHVYWALHAINLILACVALVSWWRGRVCTREEQGALRLSSGQAGSKEQDSSASAHSFAPSPSPQTNGPLTRYSLPFTLAGFTRLAPWLLLALIFWIPGVYLEWPADPWEHLRRINEWGTHDVVGEFSAGYKSFYFFAYSLVGRFSVGQEFVWLNLYYTGMCLLLSWQYYRLAQAVGLERRWAFLFVIVNALTFGNVTFSFFRYYGLASTMFAQIGAVALIRIAVEVAADGIGPAPRDSVRAAGRIASSSLVSPPLVPSLSLLGRSVFPAVALISLIALDHIQGIGIAGLGVGGVTIWRLIAWRRSMIWWLAAAAILLSVAAVHWWPRNLELDSILRPYRWLTAWYGFNLFSPSSPALDRALQILGFFGVVNLAAGVFLLRHNHVAGWLTVGPVLALCLPFVAIPLANAVASSSSGVWYIIMYHRMLLAIPAGLATICLGGEISERRSRPSMPQIAGDGQQQVPQAKTFFYRSSPFFFLVVGAIVLVIVPANRWFYNRFWHFLSITPRDLRMQPIVSAAESVAMSASKGQPTRLVATASIAYVFNTALPRNFGESQRFIGQPIVSSLTEAIAVSLSRESAKSQPPTLTQDPWATEPSAWTALAGSPPEFLTGLNDVPEATTALQNPPGRRSDVFTSRLVAIDPAQDYLLEWSVRQRAGANATAYLAVAWYDEKHHLLVSYAPSPDGADNPIGWSNGTYSYFGLVGNAAPTAWTTYRTSFGPDEAAAIPANAKFVRIGALLNYNTRADATIQLTNVRLQRKSKTETVSHGAFPIDEHLLVVAPSGWMLHSPTSLAAYASRHWTPQQVAVDLSGGVELAAAAGRASRTDVEFAASGVLLNGDWEPDPRNSR